jgi:hypothetical protein
MAKPAKYASLGRLMSVSLWRDQATGEADGSILISADFGYGAAKLRIANEDLGDLVDSIIAVAPRDQREEILERLARRFAAA